MVNLIHKTQIKSLPLSADIVKNETEKDTILSRVVYKIKDVWPNTTKSLPKELYPFFYRKLQLTVRNGCILYSHRVVMPSSLQQQILAQIHEGHMGIVRMKSLARMHVWWPKIDDHIEIHSPVKKIHENQPEHQFLHGRILQIPLLILQDLLKDQCGL